MRTHRAWTLIELLVVISIILLLAGIAFPVAMKVRRQALRTKAATLIQTIKMQLVLYEGDYGDYPPSSLSELGVETNGRNDGIESLVTCLSTTRRRGPYVEFDTAELENRDGDRRKNFNRSYIVTDEAYELVDPWGNPYFYLHHRDFAEPGRAASYVLADGTTVEIAPEKDPKTGSFPSVGAYLLWSAGPDGVNENGGGDDIPSWGPEKD